jgi:GNAT superfamily N-acetyltransferase
MFIKAGDGAQLYVRHIRPSDKEMLANGWLELSPRSQYRRFLAPKPVLTKGDLRYLTEIDGNDHVALVAVCLDDPSRLVAVARYVRLAHDPDAAEVAVTVADHMQGKKIGKQLGVLLADEARGRGVKRFTAALLAENRPALRLMATMTDRLVSHIDQGVTDVVADLAA